ncbi:phage regulatory protein/antirepressor Ant [bacterium]|nr:phage regulatory protein/antirepressor Ant [bacterium]
MTDLIPIENIDGEPRVDSRLIATELGVEHKHTLDMIRKYEQRFEKYGRVAFQTAPLETAGGVQNTTVCHLNEQQATFLVTLSRNSEQAVELKQKLTDSYFHYKQKTQFQIPATFAEALRLAAETQEKLEQAQPKIEFFDQVADAAGLHNMGDAAKMLGYGRNTFFAKLREMKILMGSNIPYQTFIDRGYFEVKENVVGGEEKFLKSQTFVTGKGLIWLENQFKVRAA